MWCILAAAFVLVARLYYIQIHMGSEYARRVDIQYFGDTKPLFERGTIFFESKDNTRVAAATQREGYTLSIVPKNIIDPELTFGAISGIFPTIPKEQFIEKAQKANDPYEEIARKIPVEKGAELRKLDLDGVVLEKVAWRAYPGGTSAAHTLGFTTEDSNRNHSGKYGLERMYDSVLYRPSEGRITNFFAEIFADREQESEQDEKDSDTLNDAPFEKPGNLIVTIEPTAQSFLETTLDSTQKSWNPDSVGGIIMNPQTGEIIAMSARPTFDPNDRQVESPKVFSNPLVEDAYEMGSIIKALSMAIGIETKAVTPDTTYKDEGVVMMNGKAVRNVDSRAYGTVDMQTVLNKSLNTGIAFVMTKVGREEFSKRMLAYGLGKKTGIDLPVEQTGLVGNLSVNRDLEYANAGFGQGISMTPIQAIRALATLANGGKLVTPHILKKIEYQDGTEFTPKLPEPVQVLSTDTADTITKMLVNIVDVALRNGTVKMPRYTIAAKTGTAQIADPTTKRYYTDRYLHSFFGYFPAYDPKFIVLLYQVNPKGAAFAAETLTGPFMDTAKFLINYYELPPDR